MMNMACIADADPFTAAIPATKVELTVSCRLVASRRRTGLCEKTASTTLFRPLFFLFFMCHYGRRAERIRATNSARGFKFFPSAHSRDRFSSKRAGLFYT